MTVDAASAAWLKADGSRLAAANPGAAAWGDVAVTSEIMTPYDSRDDAITEGAAQIAFLGGSRVLERLRVPGQQAPLVGRAVTITADAEGYRTGALVFVLSADELSDDDSTTLRVIRRLA